MIALTFQRELALYITSQKDSANIIRAVMEEGEYMSTLKDVAQRAGVSSITVSRVINTPELVKEKTKDKVMLAMAELKYVPNAAAKNLAVNRTGLIDVFIPAGIDLSNPFVMHFIAGISNVLSKRVYPFLILRDKKTEHLCDGYIITGLLRDEINDFYSYAS